MQKIDKQTLKNYLLDRSFLSDDNYDIEKITTCEIVNNVMGEKAINITIQFSLNDRKELYSDNISIHYNTYKRFIIKQRKQKIDKICLIKNS